MSFREKFAKILSATRQKLLDQQSKLEGPLDSEYSELEQEGPCPGRADLQHDAMVGRGLCQAALANTTRNRYCNLFPYDTNRVKLNTPGSESNEQDQDYINASWINIEGVPVRFILTMAPLHPSSYSDKRPTDFGDPSSLSTCEDFWRMVDQVGAKVVVMLCTIQPGFQGCSQYFPDVIFPNQKSKEITFGDYTIKLKSLEESGATVTRELTVSRGEQSRTVRHVQFTKWPNYGVVENARDLADFVESVTKMKEDDSSPLVVHCSGGVGRSGTFTSIYSLNYAMKRMVEEGGEVLEEGGWVKEGALSLVNCVQQLRRQRHPWVVEGLHQYQLAYATAFILLQNVILDSNPGKID